MLTLQGLLTGKHEAHHVAMILYLGRDVVSVNRQERPGQHGEVIWRGATNLQAQMIYLAPAVAMLEETSPTHYNYDCREALKLGDVNEALVFVQAAQQDPRYRRMMHRCWLILNSKVELTADDIKTLKEAS